MAELSHAAGATPFKTAPAEWRAEEAVRSGTPTGPMSGETLGSNPRPLGIVGGHFFFAADDDVHGTELWRTDGTAAGTVLVRDVRSGPPGSQPGDGVELGGRLFFTAVDGSGERTLWRTDGTDSGTELVFDPEVYGPGVSSLVNVGGTLMFFLTGDDYFELWKSNGTADGTRRVAAVNRSLGFARVSPLVPLGGIVLFKWIEYEGAGETTFVLKRSDGTAAGTFNLLTIPNTYEEGIGDPFPVGGTAFFGANTGSGGYELWKTDGSRAGTNRVKDINPGEDGSRFSPVGSLGSRFLFRALKPDEGAELFRTDGTAGGTNLVRDIRPGKGGSFPSPGAKVGSHLYFAAADGDHGRELWRSDGLKAGTVLAGDLVRGQESSRPRDLTEVGGALFFTTRVPDGTGQALWTLDGAPADAAELRRFPRARSLFEFGGRLVFAADDGRHGMEPWISDGTRAGTRLIADLNRTVTDGS